MKEYISAEITGTEATFIEHFPYAKPRKHPLLTYLYEMSVIAGIAAIVGTALWWTWNK